jgi:acyl-CoA thioesterase YciA
LGVSKPSLLQAEMFVLFEENVMMQAATARTDQDSAVPTIMPRGELAARHLAMPANTNPAGKIFGGWIMASMDAAASMTTTRLTEAQAVTVAVSNMVFMQPVQVGDTVCFYTDVKRVGRTSVTLDVEVWVLRLGCRERIKVTQAEFTFVAVGEDGRPRQITLQARQ